MSTVFSAVRGADGKYELTLKISGVDINSGVVSTSGKNETIVSVKAKPIIVDGVTLNPQTFSVCTPVRPTAKDRNVAKLAAAQAQVAKLLALQAAQPAPLDEVAKLKAQLAALTAGK